MIRVMRIVNVLLLLTVALSFGVSLLKSSSGDMAGLLGTLLGFVAFSAPFYLAWRGLSASSALSNVQRARVANIVLLGGIVVVTVAIAAIGAATGEPANMLFLGLLLLLWLGIPAFFNIKALRKRKVELGEGRS